MTQKSITDPDLENHEMISLTTNFVKSWFDYWGDNITRAIRNTRFNAGMQWESGESEIYKQKRKPLLTVNKVKPLVNTIEGKQIASNVSPIPIPVNSEVPQNDVDLVCGLMKRRLYDSDAGKQWALIYHHQIVKGWGVAEITTDYADPKTFNQEIGFHASDEPINVFFDVFASRDTKDDGDACGKIETMSKDQFRTRWPDAEYPETSFMPFNQQFLSLPLTDAATVITIYRRVKKPTTLVHLSNGLQLGQSFDREVYSADVKKTKQEYLAQAEENGVPLEDIPPLKKIKERDTIEEYIECKKLTTLEVLETTEWHDSELPYKFIGSDKEIIDGKEIMISFIEGPRDAQRLYNYVISEIASAIKNSRREKIFMTKKQLAGHESMYRNPETQTGVLLYNPDPQVPGVPGVVPPQQVNSSLFQLAQMAAEDIGNTTGVTDPLSGNLPNLASGEAIGRTVTNSNMVIMKSLDKLYDGQKACAQAFLRLMPTIYDTERALTITDENGSPKQVVVNTQDEEGNPLNMVADIAESIKEVEIKVGASFEEQQHKALTFLMQMFQNPQAAGLIADLIPEELDLQISPKLTARLRNMLPPDIRAKEEGEPPPATPPPTPQAQLAQAKIQEMGRKAQYDSQLLNFKQDELAQNTALQQTKNQTDVELDDTKENAAMAKVQMELELAQIKAQNEMYKEQLGLVKTHMETSAEIHATAIKTHGELAKAFSKEETDVKN